MNQSSHVGKPVVEPKPGDDQPADLTERALRLRIRQQEILAELGVLALQGTPFEDLLKHTARLTAEGLRAEYSKVLEYIPSEKRLLVRAGIGWDEGVIGSASVGADLASPAGFALHTGKPVISNHLEIETRFRTPELLVEHGIRRAMNVILQGDGSPFGVLEVDSRSEGEFGEHDVAFLQGAANILGMAIEQQQYQRKLKAALDRHQILLKEVNHRVKNSLQLVASLLGLQLSQIKDPEARRQFEEAGRRINTVASIHQRLYQDENVDRVAFDRFLRDLCTDLGSVYGHERITIACDVTPCHLDTGRVIPVALIINELIANAFKYSFPQGASGSIRVDCREEPGAVVTSVSDDGVALPAGFDPGKSAGLGMRMIVALTRQLRGTLGVEPLEPGKRFTLRVPIDDGNAP